MGIKRIVDTGFWTDDKVVESFSPEDKLFMLYLMTNPHTTQLGIYPLNKKIMAFELGYSVDAVSVLIDRFETQYNIIRYSIETNEIALKNSLRHSIVKGGKPVEDLLLKEIKKVKNKSLLKFVYDELIMHDNLNKTVEVVIDKIKNDIENDNDNDNDVSYHDSYHDSSKAKEKDKKKNILDEFETLWKLYPRKIGKDKALKSYQKARKSGTTYETVEQGIKNYCNYIIATKTTTEYIKHGSTWFNNSCWNDDYDTDERGKQNGTNEKFDADSKFDEFFPNESYI